MIKILSILIFASLFLPPSISHAQIGIDPPPTERRPDNCIDEYKTEQCVAPSADGYTLHFWYKPGSKPADEKFEYAAISHETGMPSVQSHIYKSITRTSPQFYAVVGYVNGGNKSSDGLSFSKYTIISHYMTSENTQWDANPEPGGANYIVRGTNDPGLVTGLNGVKVRYSFRVVINGNIEFENTSGTIPVNGARIQMRIIGGKSTGPPMENVKTDDKGFFEFSRAGWTNEEVWLNINNVPKVILQIQYESGGLKYEKFVDYSYPTQFTSTHSDDKVKALLGQKIKLTPNDNVPDFSTPIGTNQGVTKELLGPNAKGGLLDNALKAVLCWLRKAFTGLFYWLANFASMFLRNNY